MCYPKPMNTFRHLRHGAHTGFQLMLWAVVILSMAHPVARVRAQTAGIEMSVRAGFDGYYKEAMWIPVRVTLSNDGPENVEGIIQIEALRHDGSTIDYT